MHYNTFLINLSHEIDTLTNHFVFEGYHAVASLLQAPLGAMIVLYIVLMGYAMIRGIVQTPQHELFKFTLRAGVIYMSAMNWDFFASHIKDLFVVTSESVSSTLMQAMYKQPSSSITQGLQNILNEILKLGSDLFDAGSFRKLTPYFAGTMVFLSGSISVGLAFIEIVTAKLMLSITLCSAPLFIIFTLFDQTKSLFDRWLGMLLGFSFVLVFVSSVVGFSIHLLHWITFDMLHNPAHLKASIWVPLFIVACLCVMGITQAAAIGKSIGGAICTSGGAAMVGGFIGGSMGTWAFSKHSLQQQMNLARQGLSGGAHLFQKGQHMGDASKALIKKIHQNLRGRQ
jgi:type IV secretion system protein VirB6